MLAADLGGEEHVIGALDRIVEAGRRRWPAAHVEVEHFKDAGAKDLVDERIRDFGLPQPGTEISMKLLGEKLVDRKVLCVREGGHASFERVLSRAGFPPESWAVYFEEETFDHGSLNSLVAWLQLKSKKYCRIVYAWHGLKYLGERDFDCPVHQGGDVRNAVDRFKEWILAKDESE